MVDNKLAGLAATEDRLAAAADAGASEGAGQTDVQTASADGAPAETGTGNATGEPAGVVDPMSSKTSDEQVDAVVTRTEPEKDAAAADKASQPASVVVSTGSLNAGSVDNTGQVPDATSQATGNSPANKYPAPTPTRDSAVHQLDLKIAELAYFCNDFNHKLDPARQAMVDAIRSYSPG